MPVDQLESAVNLRKSPRHARSVALVLSLLTGYVSARLHLKHDDLFETLRVRFTPEETADKPKVHTILQRAVQGVKRKVRWQPCHSTIVADWAEEGE